jgi:ribosomal protein S18 acetylase RimI-like enzyme
MRQDPTVTSVRDYRVADERAWLRCRVLAFLGSAYFDDVLTAKPQVSRGAEIVAEHEGELVGVLDLAVEGDLATMETIAVHPDHQRKGVGAEMLTDAVRRARALGATQIDAWTRDDPSALAWYRGNGFEEQEHYLHVYADSYVDPGEPDRAVTRQPGLNPIKVFLHGRIEDEARWRGSFRRVHVCRQFVRRLDG